MQLKTMIKENQIDLIISHDYKANFYAFFANRSIKLPHIGYYHGRTDENFKVKLYNFIDSKILARLPKILTVSKATSLYLIEKGVTKEDIEIVYNAIEIHKDHLPKGKLADVYLIVGIIGRLSHEKGVHVFLEALASIKDQIPTTKFWIFGDGPDEKNLNG